MYSTISQLEVEMIGPESLALAVLVIPLFGSLLIGLLARLSSTKHLSRIGWPIAAITTTVTFVLSVVLTTVIVVHGPIEYSIDPSMLTPPVIISADAFSAVVIFLDVLLAVGILVYTRTVGPRGSLFYMAYLFLVACVIGVAVIGDLFMIYLFILGVSIATGILVDAGKRRGATYAAFKLVVMGAIGATIYLFGVLLLVRTAGSFSFGSAAEAINSAGYQDPYTVTVFILMFVGLGVNIALFPVHTWLARAHADAPDAVSALVSGVVPAVGIYAFTRVAYTIFGAEFLEVNATLTTVLLITAIVTMLAGNLFALLQEKMKLLLAYSTISQVGLVMTGLMIANERAVFGAILHIFGHGIIKGALCLVAGMFALQYGARTMTEYAGLADRMPASALTFGILGIAMIGLPPTVGFIGKWYIATGAIAEGLSIVAFLVIVSTLSTLAYVLPFINRVYFVDFDGPTVPMKPVSRKMVIGIVIAALLAISIGVLSGWIETLLSPAITDLLQ